ncbi:MAG: DUF3768 domain-containing protein [Pseudomonadota bacterium]
MSGDRSKWIAELNDRFRVALGISQLCGGIPGQCLLTCGIADLDKVLKAEVLDTVRSFSVFEEGNDPYGEHDFGAFDIEGVGKVFWNIDYYENTQCLYGAEHPENLTQSYRVLTIMLAEEY